MARRQGSRSTASESQTVPPAPEARAQAEACRLLARAPRSETEVAAHLEARGFEAAAIAHALQALRDLRYIDDADLARRRAEELLLRRGCGRVKARHELTRRGVADSVAQAAIAVVLAERDESDLARSALRRRFRTDASQMSAAERGRAFRFLVGRGHPPEVAGEVIRGETED